MNQDKRTIEVCFSPKLYDHKLTGDNFIVVVADILRATTSICAAMDHGVKEIIPVAGIDEARQFKNNGFFVACERDGKILDFADVGNSPSDFLIDSFKQNTVAFSTTNGTKAINLARDAVEVAAGAFVNLSALAAWLINRDKNVVVLCAGWKNLFNLEDTLFAGAITDKLIRSGHYITICDSAKASLDLWKIAREDLAAYLSKSSHRNRLRHLVSDADYQYTVTLDSTNVVPVYRNDRLVAAGQQMP